MAAQAHSALHVALHRDVQALVAESQLVERACAETHHDFRPADHRDAVVCIETALMQKLGHHADLAAPIAFGPVHGDVQVHVVPVAPEPLPEELRTLLLERDP